MSSSTKACAQRQTIEYVWKMERGASSGVPPVKRRVSLSPEMVGMRFSSWEVISTGLQGNKLHCRCACGVVRWVEVDNLTSGKSTRCKGCATAARHERDGELSRRGSALAEALANRGDAARSRCCNPNDPQWARYGERGIEFRFPSVRSFVEYVLTLPNASAHLEIDRIDNNGHYEVGNLRFASRRENVNNRHNTCMVQTANGAMPLSAWPSPYSYNVTYRFAMSGMTAEQIVATAWDAVHNRRKNWRGIQAKLLELGYTT